MASKFRCVMCAVKGDAFIAKVKSPTGKVFDIQASVPLKPNQQYDESYIESIKTTAKKTTEKKK